MDLAGMGSAAPSRAVIEAIERDRVRWRLAVLAYRTLLVAPLLFHAAFLALAVVDPASYQELTDEDGIVEWLQFATLLLGGGLFLALARQSRSSGLSVRAVTALLAGVAILMVAGEEISWGQRVFGWVTPDVLQVENAQGETNLHNLHVAAILVRLGQLAAAAYGVLVPLAAIILAPRFRRLDPILIPPLALVTFFLPLAVYWVLRIPLVPSFTMTRFSEVPELAFYVGIALVALLNLRRDAGRDDRVAVPRRATMRP